MSRPTTGLWTWSPPLGWAAKCLMEPPVSPLLWKMAASQRIQVPESPLGGETPRTASTPKQPLCGRERNIYCVESMKLGVDTFTTTWPHLLSLIQQTLGAEPHLCLHLPLALFPDTLFLFQPHPPTCHRSSTHLHMQTPCPASLLSTASLANSSWVVKARVIWATLSFVTPSIIPCSCSPGPGHSAILSSGHFQGIQYTPLSVYTPGSQPR